MSRIITPYAISLRRVLSSLVLRLYSIHQHIKDVCKAWVQVADKLFFLVCINSGTYTHLRSRAQFVCRTTPVFTPQSNTSPTILSPAKFLLLPLLNTVLYTLYTGLTITTTN